MAKSVLYVRLPCWKIYPGGLISIADYVKKHTPAVNQRILDLSLTEPSMQRATLKEAVKEMRPDIIAFSWRNIQTFSPHDGTPALEATLRFDYSARIGDRLAAAWSALFLVGDFIYQLRKNISLIHTARRARPDARIVVGGTGFSCFPERLIRKFPPGTVGVVGEGERAMLRVIRDEGLEDESVVYVENGEVVRHRSREYISLEDSTPTDFKYIKSIFPEFDQYLNDEIGIQTKRGCPFRCAFCIYNRIEGRQMRYRPPEVVASDIKHLARNYGIKRFWFTDSQFIASEASIPVVEETLDRIIAERLGISWSGYIRIEKIENNLAQKMLRSGIWSFDLSFTGSQKIIDSLDLRYTIEEQMAAFRRIKDADPSGRQIKLYLPLNSPGETAATLLETIDACKRLYGMFGEENVYPWLFFLGIQSGTEIERKLIRDGYLKPDYNPLSFNPFVIKKLLYNPPPLGGLIAKAYLEARQRTSGKEADRTTLRILEEKLRNDPA